MGRPGHRLVPRLRLGLAQHTHRCVEPMTTVRTRTHNVVRGRPVGGLEPNTTKAGAPEGAPVLRQAPLRSRAARSAALRLTLFVRRSYSA